ncbi:class I SAM-dependent methyltransferase [Candidatus Nitronereus thalassa]|uniref:Class I SAM-dependent methyltransferase n=1 Tax=Candidatus Nitronereus thalassa TaxID=3020898 RepID=A0ABU3K5E5_9BACT|nr:class I SAM-dependent methyltransferase [Candidatus Nitronereus thalassa]MDT7041586.1 class I SAM-dependent methyltransferase [Candidatus Nitronereus thalassa]
MSSWPLPKRDPWSTPFAETLLSQLDLRPGLSILDVACGHGIPAFYLADQVGNAGRVLGIDIHPTQLARARSIQGQGLPWLEFAEHDVRHLPATLPTFDRITGNLSFMFFRPDRYTALEGLIQHLRPAGQIVLTFPAMGTFDSLWQHVDQEMTIRGLELERTKLWEYIHERPSGQEAYQWLKQLRMEKIVVENHPLEVETGSGQEFLWHPLLRGGFLDDVFECFEDQDRANKFMMSISQDIASFVPLIAQRCVMSGWKPST